MGWHAHLAADTGGPDPAPLEGCEWSGSWNNGRWFSPAAGRTLRTLDGLPASEVGPIFAGVVAALEAEPQKYEDLNPPNGWGCWQDMFFDLRAIATACEENPRAVFYLH